MADAVVVINCGSAGGNVATDTDGMLAAISTFEAANAVTDQTALTDFVDATNPGMQIANLTATQVIPDDTPDTGNGGD